MGDGPRFFETRMGATFYDHTMPRLAAAVERVAEALDRKADGDTVDQIAALLDGREWTADTASAIADVVRRSGRAVTDPR